MLLRTLCDMMRILGEGTLTHTYLIVAQVGIVVLLSDDKYCL